jgi:hypothetical protein
LIVRTDAIESGDLNAKIAEPSIADPWVYSDATSDAAFFGV